jgi:hypothetical protein
VNVRQLRIHHGAQDAAAAVRRTTPTTVMPAHRSAAGHRSSNETPAPPTSSVLERGVHPLKTDNCGARQLLG